MKTLQKCLALKIVLICTVIQVTAQTRVTGGVADREGDLLFSQVLPRIEKFWLAIGRGRIEPSAIRWRKEVGYQEQHVFVVWAGGATLRLDSETGNLAWFVDYRRRKEQRSNIHEGHSRFYSTESGEKEALKVLAQRLGMVNPTVSHYYQIGKGFTNTENPCRRFGGEIYSTNSKVKIKVLIQSSDGHVVEMFAGLYRNPDFRMCSP